MSSDNDFQSCLATNNVKCIDADNQISVANGTKFGMVALYWRNIWLQQSN